MKEFLMGLLISAPGILFGLTVHEYAHGYAAYKMGDPTAKLAGRLTLNPIPHLDLLGTAMLFLVHFGWAKPVPINPAYFRDRRKGIIYTSFAGPLANIIVAFLFGLILRFVFVPNLLNPSFSGGLIQIIHLIIFYAVFINLILAFFNLIPIPPLDGSHILKYLLPSQARVNFEQIERFGPFILIGIIFLGRMAGISIFGLIILPPVDFFFKLFTGVPLGIYGIM
jgi:Zn-dependent protease